MVRLHEVRTVDKSIDEVFAYTADFANIESWDPGVASSQRVGDGPVGVGAEFDLRVRFGPSTAPMRYRITEYEPPHRVVLVGEGRALTAVDEITFSVDEGGTRIEYIADLDFKGPFTLLEQLFSGRLHEIGKKAVDGLERALS